MHLPYFHLARDAGWPTLRSCRTRHYWPIGSHTLCQRFASVSFRSAATNRPVRAKGANEIANSAVILDHRSPANGRPSYAHTLIAEQINKHLGMRHWYRPEISKGRELLNRRFSKDELTLLRAEAVEDIAARFELVPMVGEEMVDPPSSDISLVLATVRRLANL